jgi:hypothetical protein
VRTLLRVRAMHDAGPGVIALLGRGRGLVPPFDAICAGHWCLCRPNFLYFHDKRIYICQHVFGVCLASVGHGVLAGERAGRR